ncbi:ATP-binding cassette domain-containing protein [Comamonas sp. NLF-1-9]|uniref:ABC transporter ATP-binding protein n=1 Tax=Comamonas sp. NLF-1-9 TaxID=2853163 RepID=UPI001C444B28|nr:ATP-binding cassette domain-containing protein [Comamonas sp. NLF-1-9]QXL85690.1 ATP-binding cassette domain-containing protein [Comamonas sp. NLF-1-9]
MTEENERVCLQALGLALAPGAGCKLHGWNASFGPGLSLLLDEEGDGKTALLRVLAGELPPAAGELRWCGAALAEQLRRAPQTVFWRDPRAEWPEISPAQWAIELAARYPHWNAAQWQQLVQALALQEHLHKEMFRLSTGGKRKVLLAAALASGAPLTLIDEPEAALDRASIVALRAALAQQGQASQRVFIVGHYEVTPELPWSAVVSLR